MDISTILEKCDHTLLRVDCTSEEIRALCDQAIKYHCASVCIPPCHVAGAKRYVGDRMKICTVIGFPNGYMTSAAKAFEAQDAIKNGADEIDMVINLSMVKDACWDAVAADISAVREATRGYILKVIIECCLLTEEDSLPRRRLLHHAGGQLSGIGQRHLFHHRFIVPSALRAAACGLSAEPDRGCEQCVVELDRKSVV